MSKIKRTFTKAESLHILKKNEKKLSIKVPSFIYFTKKKYKKDYKKILNRVQKIFKKKN